MDLSVLPVEHKQLALDLIEAGRVDDAIQLLAAYDPAMGQRTSGRQYGTREEQLARGRELGMDRDDLFVPPESGGSMFLADMGAGFVEQGLGAQQLAEHLIPGRDTRDIDERVVQARETYEESGLADEVTGGNLASKVIPAIGGGVLARGALTAAPLRTSMALGAAEEAVQPVVEGEYITEKAKDIGIGATVGAVTEGVPASLIRGTEMVVDAPGKAYRALQRPKPGDKGEGWFRGDPETIQANVKLGEDTGISFTPGQVTETPAIGQVEELARSGLFTRNKVAEADAVRAGQYDEYIKGFRDSLGDDAPIDVVAPKIQAWGKERAAHLINKRHVQANEDYAPIRAYEGMIEGRNYANELERIIADGQTAGASEDMIRAAKGAEQRLTRLEEQGGYLTGSDIELLTRATDSKFSGSPFDLKDPTFNEQIASRIKQAATADAKTAPAVFEQLQTAKKNYAKASGHIDEFETGLLGQVMGKDFASAVDGVVMNTKSPEFLFQKFRSGSPTQITAAFKHLDAEAPEMAMQLRASFLERARQGATFRSSSAGATSDLDPATFLRNLGLTGGGEKGMQGYERLLAMFPGQEDAINNLYRAGQILGDKSLANTSKTAVTTEAREAFRAAGSLVTGALTQFAGFLGGFLGLKGVANSMDIGRGYRVAPQPVNLRRTRRVQDVGRIPVLATTTTTDLED